MTHPLVSVCIPNYNKVGYIAECLSSLHRQTYENWEGIICDSGSTDGSINVIESFVRMDERLKLHLVPRNGVYAGWNECLRRANGELIYMATSDDTMYARCLERAVAGMEAHPGADLCHFCIDFIDDRGNTLYGEWERQSGPAYYGSWNRRVHWRSGDNEIKRMLFLGSVYFSITELVFRRDSFEEFPEDEGAHGDFAWLLQNLSCKRILHLSEKLATWRRISVGSQETRHDADYTKVQHELFWRHAGPGLSALVEPAHSYHLFRRGFHLRKGRIRRLSYCLGNSWGRKLLMCMAKPSPGSSTMCLLKHLIPVDDLQPC